jgi:predicted helicase
VTVQRRTHLKQTPSLLPQQSKFDLDDSDLIIDDEVTFGRNRRSEEFGKVVQSDELSDYVKFRLWLARRMAMAKYKEKWA